MRPYKGVENLLQEFILAQGENSLSLRVIGAPQTRALAERLHQIAGDEPSIRLELERVNDDALATAIVDSELVVLPYRDIHNSGAALLALSLDRPILVPSNDVTIAWRQEFGDDYVHLYAAELTADDLAAAVARVRSTDWASIGPVSMDHRDWPSIGQAHREAYLQALGDKDSVDLEL
ncbi:hypothetical protein QQX09_06125 [Demequina sp. SYSU T00192]|uniref:O-GlcNAc transferase C-terminal domain-containing protein n=1 Tax=Demequina litoralis TaxID=3051660 RepID=A0ABT8G8H7_9MICO|nr:hypothetical protein [Demequina sp. SYSU T00192]MDN4475428.1 hypothetical protein [Demequina sp. SYSU T00192]